MIKLFIECFTKKYFQFQGRASRKEYLSFLLITNIIELICSLTLLLNFYTNILTYIAVGYLLFSTIPSISVSIRRLHDLNISGWWGLLFIIVGVLLTSFAPRNIITTISIFIIATIGIYFALKKGTPGPNKYGEPPT